MIDDEFVDKEELIDINNKKKFVFFEIFVGLLGLVSSIASVFVATFIGVTSLSLQNGSLLLLLSILIISFLTIRAMIYFFDDNKKNSLLCFIIVFLNIVIFVIKIIEFISIPLLIVV